MENTISITHHVILCYSEQYAMGLAEDYASHSTGARSSKNVTTLKEPFKNSF